jgi:hypothetical protein
MADPVNPNPTEPVAVASSPVPVSPPADIAPSLASPVEAAAAAQTAAPAEALLVGGASAPIDPAEVPTLLEEHGVAKAAAEPAKPADAPKKDEPAKPVTEGKPEEKAAEAKAAEAAPPAEPLAAEPVKPEPVEYKYTIPEVIKLDDARKAELHTALDEFRANPAEGAQKLMNLHASAMTAFKDSLLQLQKDAFNDTRKEWRTKVMADAEIGGAGHMTAMQAIARVRDAAVSAAKPGSKQYQADMAAFNDALRITGAGDHPAILRAFHNMARWMDEPQSTTIPTEITPPKGNGRAPKSSMYDHPSSAKMAGRS